MSSNYADEEAYESMISALKKFAQEVSEAQSAIQKAIEDCKDNMDQDPHADEKTQGIEECYPALADAADRAIDLAGKIQRQLDIIRNA